MLVGDQSLFKWSRSHDQNDHHVHICVKPLKKYFPVEPKGPGWILTYFTEMSNLVPYAFVWEKGKTMDFSETIAVYDKNVYRCSQPNEYMKLYEYQRSVSFSDLHPRSLRFNIFKCLLLINP